MGLRRGRLARTVVAAPGEERDRGKRPDTVRDELAEFATCVPGVAPEVDDTEALEVVAVLEGIIESARTGRAVDLDEVRARV